MARGGLGLVQFRPSSVVSPSMVPPLIVPQPVMRSTGVQHVHVAVHTSRLVLRCIPGTDVYRVLGTVDGVLCHIPIRERLPSVSGGAGLHDVGIGFRNTCRSVAAAVLPSSYSPSAYGVLQWFAAILDEGASLESGGCTLLSLGRGPDPRVMMSRRVDDSLAAEMARMGCISMDEGVGGGLELDPLPPYTNDLNRNIVTLKKVVDTLGVVYDGAGDGRSSHSSGVGGNDDRDSGSSSNSHLCIVSLPGQSLDVHRMVSMGSDAMLHMRDGFRGLWAKSFDAHMCYRVDRGGGGVLKLNH